MIILRQNNYSKKDSGDVKVYTSIINSKKIKDLTDEQLKNIIKFESPRSQKNVKKNSLKAIAGMALIPSAAGYTIGKLTKKPMTIKQAAIMSGINGTLGAIIAQGGYKHHKKEVEAAKKELEKRGIELNY